MGECFSRGPPTMHTNWPLGQKTQHHKINQNSQKCCCEKRSCCALRCWRLENPRSRSRICSTTAQRGASPLRHIVAHRRAPLHLRASHPPSAICPLASNSTIIPSLNHLLPCNHQPAAEEAGARCEVPPRSRLDQPARSKWIRQSTDITLNS